MVLAELNVRHTRRHMPTRRVALGDRYLPTVGQTPGPVLLGAVVAGNVGGLDEEQLEVLPRFLRDARTGLSVPRIALRYRLQTDTHGLDRSRHRLLLERGRTVVELDVHGHPTPQVLGAVMAAASFAPAARPAAFRAIEQAARRPGSFPPGLVVRFSQGLPAGRPTLAGTVPGLAGTVLGLADPWQGIPAEERWAREALGFDAVAAPGRDEIQRRYRRLLRAAHPDHGGAATGAADRIADLAEARRLLLALATERRVGG